MLARLFVPSRRARISVRAGAALAWRSAVWRIAAPLLLGASFVQAAPAHSSATVRTDTPDEQPAKNPAAPIAQRGWASAASIFPGALVHGSGHWVLGDRTTAARLFYLQAAGLGSVMAGIVGLALTGAAGVTFAPLLLLSAAGVSLTSSTFLLDLYGVSSDGGWGVAPLRLPLFLSHTGYVHIRDPIFSYRHLMTHGIEVRPGAWALSYQAWYAPGQGHSRLRAASAYTLWGRAGAGTHSQDGSFSELEVAGGSQHFETQDFDVLSAEFQLKNRLDSRRLLPNIPGAFLEYDAGFALRHTRFGQRGAVQNEQLLLVGSALGVYIGYGADSELNGEAKLYYNHRRDDFAAGMKLPSIGSGAIGHVGAEGRFFFSRHWGFSLYTEFGSAWVSGLALRVRDQSGFNQ